MNQDLMFYAFGAFNSLRNADESFLTFRVIVPPNQTRDDEENDAACERLFRDTSLVQSLKGKKLRLRRPANLQVHLGKDAFKIALDDDVNRIRDSQWADKVTLGRLDEEQAQKLRAKQLYSLREKKTTTEEIGPLKIASGMIQQCIITADLPGEDSFCMLTVEHRVNKRVPSDPTKGWVGRLDFVFVADHDVLRG